MQAAGNREGSLLEPAFLARLERLSLSARRAFHGQSTGERRSLKRGLGLEFAGHRGYAEGDDLRFVDWAVLARTGKPFLKTFEQDEDLSVHILVDTSASMGFGSPSKLVSSLRIAAALAHISLFSMDRVGVALLAGEKARLHGPSRGRGTLLPLLKFLDAASTSGAGNLARSLRWHASASRPGLTVVISDCLEPDLAGALGPHIHRGHDLVVLQVLAEEELDPPLSGDLRLVDSETGATVDVTVGPKERAAYLARLRDHQESIRSFCRRHEVEVHFLSAATPIEEIVWRQLSRGTFLRGK
jgi:uncharacterized protein (DUF58 family)